GFHLLADEREHFRLNVDGEHVTLGTNTLGDAEGEIATARADVRDHVTGFQFEGVEEFGWLFFLLALRPFEPTRCLMTHDVGDFPAHVEFANAIRVVLFSSLVPGRRLGRRLRFLYGRRTAGTGRQNQDQKRCQPAQSSHEDSPGVAHGYANTALSYFILPALASRTGAQTYARNGRASMM